MTQTVAYTLFQTLPKKVITIEEYFTLPAIRAKVMKYLTEQNRGVPPVSEA